MLKSLCVIPARSGSKGLPNKNVLELLDIPVLAYSINACKESGLFDKIYVATESEEYAEIAKKYGADVPFLLPEEMTEDHVSSTAPLIHFYEKLGQEFDLLWCMQPTSPLRIGKDISDAYNIISNDEGCNYVVSTTEVDPHYFHWAVSDDDEGYCSMYFGKKFLVDRSEIPLKAHRPNGAIKVGRTKAVLETGHFFGEKIKRVEMPDDRAIHIRSQFDFDMCEFILTRRK